MTFYEAAYDTSLAKDMAEAAQREFNQRVLENHHSDDIYGLLDWWASFCQSEVENVLDMLEPKQEHLQDRMKEFDDVGKALEQATSRTQTGGMAQDRPYSWGNKSALERYSTTAPNMYYANKDKYPIIYAYREGGDPFYIPSGCAVTCWVNSKDEKIFTNPNSCDYLLNK